MKQNFLAKKCIAARTTPEQVGDDGIHADVSIAIAGGKIDIAQSEEGIEAPTIVISDGQTSLIANDDGVNVSSGSSETAT